MHSSTVWSADARGTLVHLQHNRYSLHKPFQIHIASVHKLSQYLELFGKFRSDDVEKDPTRITGKS